MPNVKERNGVFLFCFSWWFSVTVLESKIIEETPGCAQVRSIISGSGCPQYAAISWAIAAAAKFSLLSLASIKPPRAFFLSLDAKFIGPSSSTLQGGPMGWRMGSTLPKTTGAGACVMGVKALGVGAVVVNMGRLVLRTKGTALGLNDIETGEGAGRPIPRPSYSFLLASSRSLPSPALPAELGGVELVGELLGLAPSLKDPFPSADPLGLPERAIAMDSPEGVVNLRGEGRILKGETIESLDSLFDVERLSLEDIPGGDTLLLRSGGDGALGNPKVGLV